MANRYQIPPHFHPSYERVEVREGTLLVGMGDTLDRKLTRALVAGDPVTFPAGTHHYWVASGRTVVSMTFIGPFTITYLRAEDAPAATEFSLRLLEWVLRSSPGSARSASTSGASSASARRASRLLKKA